MRCASCAPRSSDGVRSRAASTSTRCCIWRCSSSRSWSTRRCDSDRHSRGVLTEALTIVAAVLIGAAYARGVRSSRRTWPWWRTLSFFAGLASLILALASGIELLAGALSSVHMLQHMLLTIVAAPLLVLGAPVRPLLRGTPAALRRGIVRPLAASRSVRAALHMLRHPLVAVAIYVGGIYLWHWPSLYDPAVGNAVLHG